MYSNLLNRISQFITLTDDDIHIVQLLFEYKSVQKNKVIFGVGDSVDTLFFISSGYLKYCKLLKSGKELIIHLYPPNDFATSLNSFFEGKKAEEELHTITDCELLCISRTNLEKLYAIDNKWQYFARKLMESGLIEKEERVIDQLTLTAYEKYDKLLKTNPQIIQNVPVKYIASFIGIEPESLSRIKKQIN